jgi:hypothetical protein
MSFIAAMDTPCGRTVANPSIRPAATVAAKRVSITHERGIATRAVEESTMDQGAVLGTVLFVCVTYAFKTVVDAATRYRMLRMGGSEERVRSILQGDEHQRRHASLRWGVVLVALAIAFGLIEAFGWREITPGVIAVLAGATGVGNLAFFAISRRLKP